MVYLIGLVFPEIQPKFYILLLLVNEQRKCLLFCCWQFHVMLEKNSLATKKICFITILKFKLFQWLSFQNWYQFLFVWAKQELKSLFIPTFSYALRKNRVEQFFVESKWIACCSLYIRKKFSYMINWNSFNGVWNNSEVNISFAITSHIDNCCEAGPFLTY